MVYCTRKHLIPFEIDDEDLERVMQHSWLLDSNGYISTTVKCKTIRLHRFLMNAPKGTYVDHVDRNKMNNHKSNLRFCSQQQNSFNQHRGDKYSSKYKGVSWNKCCKMWQAKLAINKEQIYLGVYDNENDAAMAYNTAALKYFGGYGILNDIPNAEQHADYENRRNHKQKR